MSMSTEFQHTLQKYAELTVKVGLNLQPGQRLLIMKAAIQAAPLVRRIATSAYQAGARLVDVMWGDEELLLARFQHAPLDSFEEYPTWRANGMLETAQHGDAILSIQGGNPDLLSGQDPDSLAIYQKTAWKYYRPTLDHIERRATNWSVIAAPVSGWAAKVFPDLPPEEGQARLWEVVFEACRLTHANPVAAWQDHIAQLDARCNYLSHKGYSVLKFTGPGTDLTVALPKGHVWTGGRDTSQTGITFTPNLPTEEVFTLAHKDKAEGMVTASMPLSYVGALIRDFQLTFAGGRVVKVTAAKGEAVLRKLIETDEGAGRLGEVALVPHRSPISQSGLLFYESLFDENAASHLAVGAAYKFNLLGGEAMSDADFARAGGNNSLVHVDFMIGSGEMDVDGLREDGTLEPVMRAGEWAFEAS
jgi:aminopeptidase